MPRVVSTLHPPSAVVSSVKCCLHSPDIENLVVAKLSTLDVYSIQPSGLVFQSTLPIWGKILSVKAVPLPESNVANLVVMLDHPEPELLFLSYDPAQKTLKLDTQLQLYEPTPRPAEFLNRVFVHPSGQIVVASCYVGRLRVCQLSEGKLERDMDLIIPELNLISLALLPITTEEYGCYSLALLYVDHLHRTILHVRTLSIEEWEIEKEPSNIFTPVQIKEHIVPSATAYPSYILPVQIGEEGDEEELNGVLVVGGTRIAFYELAKHPESKPSRKRKKSTGKKKGGEMGDANVTISSRKPTRFVHWYWGEVLSHTEIDQSRWLIGDIYGRLAVLAMSQFGLLVIPLGEISPPAALTYVTSQILFVGSILGPSQLVRVTPTPFAALDAATLPLPDGVAPTAPSDLSRSKGKGKEKEKPREPKVFHDEEPEPSSQVPEPDQDSIYVGHVIQSQGTRIQVLEEWKNIAPIHDAVLIPVPGSSSSGSGQNQIVTCSGGHNTGAMNIIRTGADFETLGTVLGFPEMSHGMWSIRSLADDTNASHIVTSTLERTWVFRVAGGGGSGDVPTLECLPDESSSSRGFVLKEPTICVGNVYAKGGQGYINGSLVVQVTSKGAFLLEFDMGLDEYACVAEWLTEKASEVVAASVSSTQILLALDGARITALYVDGGKLVQSLLLTAVNFTSHLHQPYQAFYRSEISAVSCTPFDSSKKFTRFYMIGFWHANIIRVFSPSVNGLQSICESPSLAAPVRAILPFDFGGEGQLYVLASLANGSVATFLWDTSTKTLKDPKTVSVGTLTPTLVPYQVEGRNTVFASSAGLGAATACTLFFVDQGRMCNSPVRLPGSAGTCALAAPAFGEQPCVVVSGSNGLRVGRVKDLNRMHIQTIPMGLMNPRRIVHQPLLHVFGVMCTKIEPEWVGTDLHRVTDPQDDTSQEGGQFTVFKLYDEEGFNCLTDFKPQLDRNEELMSVLALPATASAFEFQAHFVLGTFFFTPLEREPSSGRIIVLNARRISPHTMHLAVIAEYEVKGCVYALTNALAEGDPDGSYFVGAVNTSVMLFKLTYSPSATTYALTLLSQWNHNYLVTQLASYGSTIVVGDHISSVSILRVEVEPVGTAKLKTISRDYAPLWPVAVETFDEYGLVAANDALNLVSFSASSGPATTHGRRVLKRDGFWHIGELVTKFVKGSVESSDRASGMSQAGKASAGGNEDLEDMRPTHLFFTSSGRIGVIVDLKDDHVARHLGRLQQLMAISVKGVGSESHTRWRAPKNTRGRSDADDVAFGFLDGDLLESLLNPDSAAELNLDRLFERMADLEREDEDEGTENSQFDKEEILGMVDRLRNMH